MWYMIQHKFSLVIPFFPVTAGEVQTPKRALAFCKEKSNKPAIIHIFNFRKQMFKYLENEPNEHIKMVLDKFILPLSPFSQPCHWSNAKTSVLSAVSHHVNLNHILAAFTFMYQCDIALLPQPPVSRRVI